MDRCEKCGKAVPDFLLNLVLNNRVCDACKDKMRGKI